MPASSMLAKGLLDFVCGGATPTRPSDRFIALIDNGGVELVGANYARQTVTFAAAASPAGSVVLATPLTFASLGLVAPASVVSAAAYDSSVGGNLLWGAPLLTPRYIQPNDTFIVSTLTISLS